MNEKIKEFVKIWEEKHLMGFNPYEVKRIIDCKEVGKFYLLKLDAVYHDFAWGIGDMGEWDKVKYLALPKKVLEWSSKEIELYITEQPITGREKTKSTDDIFCEVDYEKELRLLENPEKIKSRIQELKTKLESIKKRERKLIEKNKVLQRISLAKEDYEYIQFLELNAEKVLKTIVNDVL